MDDAISRRIIKEQMLKYGFTAPDMTITEFVEDCLPSVQPEIIRCKDCKFFVSDMEWCEADDEHPTRPDAFCSWAERRDG